MTTRRPELLLGLFAIPFLVGCPGELADPARFQVVEGDAGVGVADAAEVPACDIDVVAQIFQNEETCASSICHDDSEPEGALDLLTKGHAARMVGVASTTEDCAGELLIDPENPDNSLLVRKLTQESEDVCGDRMPWLFPDPLPQSDIDCVRAWVAGVAAEGPAAGADGGVEGGEDAGESPDMMDGGATMDAGMEPMMPADGKIYIEAEDADMINAPMTTESVGDASGGEYVVVPMGAIVSMADQPHLVFTFDVAEAGQYLVWGRILTATVDDDSWWVRVNGGTYVKWNNNHPGGDQPAETEWEWDDVHDSDAMGAQQVYDLTAGENTLEISYREDGAKLDRILIVPADLDFQPSGLGE